MSASGRPCIPPPGVGDAADAEALSSYRYAIEAAEEPADSERMTEPDLGVAARMADAGVWYEREERP